MKKVLWIVLMSLFYSCASSEKAINFFESAEYELAIKSYKKQLDKNPENKAEINFRIAESYRLSNRIQKALPFYQSASKSGYKSDNLQFFIGYALKANGKHGEASTYFTKYVETGKDEQRTELAKKEVKNLATLQEIIDKETYTTISACDKINTEASEFAPVIYGNKVIFSSSRRGEEIFYTDGTGFTDLYAFEVKDTTDCKGKITNFFNESINTDGRHEANATFSADGKTMIFARSNSANKDEKQKDVNLYASTFNGSSWSAPRMLRISRVDAWDSSPVLSPDGKILYFSSNRGEEKETTESHLDLYKSVKEADGSWSTPERLGKEINTNGNEAFPYVDKDGNFYFASDGHQGLGRLDLFQVDTLKNSKKLIIKNLGKPVNSTSDDFGIVFRSPVSGYFTSNRTGGEAQGDDDIYQFQNDSASQKSVVYYLRGVSYVHQGSGKKILPETTVKLLDDKGTMIESKISDKSGNFKFEQPVEIDKKYHVVGEKDTYVSDDFHYSTFGRGVDLNTLPVGENVIYFDTLVVLEKDIFAGDTIPELEILYEYDSTRITKKAGEKLDEFAYFLKKYLKQHSTTVIELGSHTDSRGSDDYNRRLSEGRARAAVNYLVKNGINSANIKAKGYGESDLKFKNAKTEPEHQINRRTTVKILKQDE